MIKKKTTKKVRVSKKKETLEQKAAENLAGWKRALADYENYRHRTEEKEKELIKYANENLILEMLPVLDNFQSAYGNLPKSLEKDNWAEGIKYIKVQMEKVLESQGVKIIKTVGEKFDPSFHEAVEKVKGKGKKDEIAEEVLGGYTLEGKVIRPAKVKVN